MQIFHISIIFLFAILAVSFAEISQGKRDKIKKAHDDCQDDPDSCVEKDVVERMNKGEGTSDDRIKAGKHALCINIKIGIQNADGDVITKKLKEEMTEDLGDETKANDIVTTCTRPDKSTATEAALSLTNCIYKKLGVTPSNI